jgi:hypothetical protein
MDFKSKETLLPTNANSRNNGNSLSKEKRDEIFKLTADGKSNEEIEEITGVSRTTIIAIKKSEIANNFSLTEWKRKTSSALAGIVTKGSQRLEEEIENIPAGQLPIALAILIDKVVALQDAPTIVVEHRLRVSHEDINEMIRNKVDKTVIDITPKDQPK